jgi:hypothetical protein
MSHQPAPLVPLTREQLVSLRHWFLPERPGPLIAQHLIGTGNGSCLADRWPDPRALVVETGGNYTLAGDPGGLDPARLRGLIEGFVEAPAAFEPLLAATARELHEWPRVVLTLEGRGRPPPEPRRRGRRAAGRAGRGVGLDRQHLGRPRGPGRERHRLGRVRREPAGRRRLPVLRGHGLRGPWGGDRAGVPAAGAEHRLRRPRLPGRTGPGPRPQLDDLARQHRQPGGGGQARLHVPAP